MNKVYCPHCNHILTAWEGYRVLNFKKLNCPNCQKLLVPLWSKPKTALWQRRLLVLLWSFPALVAMTVVWIEPSWWLYLIAALIAFHVLALTVICVGGLYHVTLKPKNERTKT